MNNEQARKSVSQAKGRERILRRWREALAARVDATKDEATAKFLAKLASGGKLISRATLYDWDRREIAGGIVGLVDGRSELAKAAPHTEPAEPGELLAFNLAGGVRVTMKLMPGTRLEVRQSRQGFNFDLQPGGKSNGSGEAVERPSKDVR
jgi:hypothetical protein